MTKKLEEFFNLDSVSDTDRSESTNEQQLPLVANELVPMEDTLTRIKDQLTVAAKIDEALPQVKGLETDDRTLDDYADQAMENFAKLMDLGFNVDDRNAGKIFEVASTMMNNAITAKTTKLDKKLKMIELQLKLAKLQKDLGKEEATDENKPGELSTDRNAILNLINQNLKKQDK
jgi:hypothetical protein